MMKLTGLLAALSIVAGCGNDNSNNDNVVIDARTGTADGPFAGVDAVVSTCDPVSGSSFRAELVATSDDAVLLVTSPAGDARKFVVERDGKIRILLGTTLSATPFLDLSAGDGGPVLAGGERGLLGLAFHPQYASNHRFFVYYTTSNANIIAEYKANDVDDTADRATGKIILSIPDFAGNHNGGMMEFGPDGFLYIGTGDGGGGGDPERTGQDVDSLLGKLLRLDIDNPSGDNNYGIPAGNPFATAGGAPEILSIGLRNPWRWSFDLPSGNIYIGDVGQDSLEELNIIPIADLPGANFGWSQYEGSDCFRAPCTPEGKTFPKMEFTQGDGYCSIIGGEVYRGSCAPDLVGTYIFTDYCQPALHGVEWNGTAIANDRTASGINKPSSLHHDALGELWLTTEDGGIYHIVPE